VNKTCLVRVNQGWDDRAETVGKDFGEEFHRVVLSEIGP
jgi:hypothetical protein